MSHYKHLTIEEREKLYLLFNQGISIRKIAAALNRSPSTISRELERNTLFWQPYSPSVAHTRYKNRRKRCGKKRILANAETKEKVREFIQDRHWSPEQVEYRLKLENSPIHISYATIYRAISSGMFDIKKKYLKKNERFSFYLRRKGKKRRKNGTEIERLQGELDTAEQALADAKTALQNADKANIQFPLLFPSAPKKRKNALF